MSSLCWRDYTGNAADGGIGKLTNVSTDFGERLEFGFDTFIKANRESYFTLKGLILDGMAGQVTPEATIGLQMSDDGKTYGDRLYVGMGNEGNCLEQVFWGGPGGLGDYESVAAIRIRTAQAVNIATEGLLADI